MAIEEVLAAIKAQLIRVQAPILSHLRPGLTRAEIDELVAPLPFRLTDELYALYQWHDGAGNLILDPSTKCGWKVWHDEYSELFPFTAGHFPPLVIAVSSSWRYEEATYPSFLEIDDGLPVKLPPHGFELSGDPGFESLVVACETVSLPSSPVFNWCMQAYDPDLRHRSLEDLYRTVLACYEEGAYYIEGGYLEGDKERERRIGKRLNPGLDYWSQAK